MEQAVTDHQHFQELYRRIEMEIDRQFYLCGGCGQFQPFMGDDVSCDCGYSNEFTVEELEDLEEAVEEVEEAEDDY